MTDAFDANGDGTFTGIELSEQEVRLRPKREVSARAVDLHGKMFFAINPSKEGDVGFNVLVDGNARRAFSGEYDAGTKFEAKDLGVNRAYAFNYPAACRTVGTHELVIILGKFVKTDTLGKNDFVSLFEGRYLVNITEGEATE